MSSLRIIIKEFVRLSITMIEIIPLIIYYSAYSILKLQDQSYPIILTNYNNLQIYKKLFNTLIFMRAHIVNDAIVLWAI